jgi:hypothetical protein
MGVGAGLLAAVIISAGPAPAAAAAADTAPKTVCTIGDKRLDELSGLVTVPGGYIAVNDGSDKASHRRIFYLDQHCGVRRTVSYPSKPIDTEDLAVAPDGTLWIADIGDNGEARKTIALWKLAAGADEPVRFTMKYPDRAHNAETLVLNGDGTPIIITKEPFAGAIYVPAGEPAKGRTTMLRATGEFSIPGTSTSNPYNLAGRFVLTGGTNSPDGTKVALRTYADAFEFAVTDGAVIAALTGGKPKIVALPDEPQGEAIAYTQDGSALVTASEGNKPDVLRYPSALRVESPSPAVPSPAARNPAAQNPAAQNPAAQPAAPADKPTLPPIVVGAGLVLVVLCFGGLIIRRRRR